MAILNASISKEKPNQTMSKTIQTGLVERVDKILIETVNVKTYFGSEVNTFNTTHSPFEDVWFQLEVDINSSTLPIIKTEYVFQSDGLTIFQRKASINDVVLIYVHVKVMVKREVDITYGDMLHLDLNPTPGHKHSVARNGYHKWIPTHNNEEPCVLEDADNIELMAKQVNLYLRPSSIRHVSVDNPAEHSSIIDGTVRNRTLFHTDESWWFNSNDYKHDPTMLRLGKVTLQANSVMQDNMTIIDTRTRGGGLDERLSKEIISQINRESLYHWDIGYFDGEAYQENGVFVVQVPRSILRTEKNPNGFHESEVQEAVAKHKAYGVLPIIEYYDEVPQEYKYNLILNPEFLDGKHIGYYNSSESSGNYEVLYDDSMGSGDNYVLKVEDAAQYVITIPGYKFKGSRYRIDVKATKSETSSIRRAGEIFVQYKNGRTLTRKLSDVRQNQWMIYKDYLEVDENIHYVTITLNKNTATPTGKVFYDYVMLIPTPDISSTINEIHEI